MINALVLAGGGSKCSWSAGTIKHFLCDLKKQYDIFCGVSAGAINAAFLAQFKTGEEEQAGRALYNLWLNLKTKDVVKRWFPLGKLHALWEKSFLDSSPLHDLIHTNISLEKIRNSGKKIGIGAVNLSTGKYHVFDQTSDYLIDAVIASATFPGMMTPVNFMDHLWMDGGGGEVCPTKTAIEMGAETIDVIATSPEIRNKKFLDKPSVIDVLKRAIDLGTDKIIDNDLETLQMHNKLVEAGMSNKKLIDVNIIRPKYNLSENLLNFNSEKIKKMLELGYAEAKEKFGNKD